MPQPEGPSAVLENRSPFVAERKPALEFSGLIEKFWSLPKPLHDAPRVFEILPDGNFDLVFALADSWCRLQFFGPAITKVRIPLPNSIELFCVRFRPGLMPRVADIKPAELVDTRIELPGIAGIAAGRLGESLCAAPGLAAKQLLMEQFFRKLGPETILPPDLASRAAALAESYGGQLRVHELAGLLGISSRTLERAFLTGVGIPPKKFLRLVRLQNALGKVRNRADASLAAMAYDCGYADQSHFIREIKSLTGRLPSRI